MYKIFKLLILIFPMAQACQKSLDTKPNIVILMADDMGYADAECYGAPIRTPNINRLAREGMRFTDFYSAAPNCSPARTGLLTGRTPSRVGVYDYLAPNSPMHLPNSEITMAEMLKDAGYQTCHVGKWHLSTWTKDGMIGPKPDEQGFEYWFAVDNNALPSHFNPINFERNGEKVGPLQGYSCQLVVDEAIQWLENYRDHDTPFFLNVWFNEPHAKIASPPELIEEYKEYGKDAEYLANVANMDMAIGKLLQFLDDKSLAENSFILFASDNGPYRQASSGIFRGKKSFLYEGGIRVPGIIKWPGKIKGGLESGTPVSFVDILPTVAEIAGAKLPGDRTIDGTNILPILLEKSFDRERPLYWYFYKRYPIAALRKGNFVIMGNPAEKYKLNSHPFDSVDQDYFKNAKLEEFQVYDLKNDPSQKQDLYPSDPDRFMDLKMEIIKYQQEILEEGPIWEGLPKK